MLRILVICCWALAQSAKPIAFKNAAHSCHLLIEPGLWYNQSMILQNFAVLEGCDGSGTTTQLRLLEKNYAAAGSGLPPLYGTAEPTGGPVGALIRSVLKGEAAVSRETLARLFAADRGEHLSGPDGITARCLRGELVVSDRYTPSSLVYQSIDCGAPLLPQSLNAAFPLPELLFYLDIDSESALRRITARGKQDIFERLEFQKKAREGYLALLPVWEREGVRVISLDGHAGPEELGREIWRALKEMPIMKR